MTEEQDAFVPTNEDQHVGVRSVLDAIEVELDEVSATLARMD